MRLNSVRRCRHCVYGAWMGACTRHLGHMSQHKRFGTYCMWRMLLITCLNAGLSFHLLCMRASKALASPYICACSPGLELLTNVRQQM